MPPTVKAAPPKPPPATTNPWQLRTQPPNQHVGVDTNGLLNLRLTRSAALADPSAKLQRAYLAARERARASEQGRQYLAQKTLLTTTQHELAGARAAAETAGKDVQAQIVAGRDPGEAEGRAAAARARVDILEERRAGLERALVESRAIAVAALAAACRPALVDFMRAAEDEMALAAGELLRLAGIGQILDRLADASAALELARSRGAAALVPILE
jgi:hypothetical protein